jgi:Lipase (class 3)
MDVQAAINAGLFVQFVYNSWNIPNQSTNLDGRPVVTSGGQPVIAGKNYKVIKTIYSNDLATDICPNRPQLEGYKTIGVIAQNEADVSDIFVAIRGTEGIWEWVQDFKFVPRPFSPVAGGGLTDDGFTDMYLSFSLTAGPSSTFMKDVASLLPQKATVTVVGHSLGSSLATLFALDMAVNTTCQVGLYTLASPRVGDLTFHNLFNHVVPNAYRVANRLDVVTQVPPVVLYLHVGDETDLLPPKTMKYDIRCEHHVSTYLNMLAALTNQQNLYPVDAACLLEAAVAPPRVQV